MIGFVLGFVTAYVLGGLVTVGYAVADCPEAFRRVAPWRVVLGLPLTVLAWPVIVDRWLRR